MVIVNFSGRTGNGLFQYAFARIIADHFKYSLEYLRDNWITDFKSAVPITRIRINSPEVIYNDTVDKNITLNQILADTSDRKIVIHGYWQKADFYAPYRDQIRKWFELSDDDPDDDVDVYFRDRAASGEDICLHLRRTDYLEAVSDLNFEYYDECIAKGNYNRIYVTGDCITDPVVRKHFDKYPNITYVGLESISTFKFIMKFRDVILSNSSYCWWATFLSTIAKVVYLPEPVTGYWSLGQDQKLYIPGFHTKVEKVGVGRSR